MLRVDVQIVFPRLLDNIPTDDKMQTPRCLMHLLEYAQLTQQY